jgi:hypothetical protein
MQEQLEIMLKTSSEGFLSPCKIDLLVFIIRTCEAAIAFTDAEHEHVPWVQALI